MSSLVFILISFLASVIGSICGIGGGVIMKPVMDAFHLYSVSTISFMSGTIVLAMSAYNVFRAGLAKEKMIEKCTGTWLGIGAALGGIAGKWCFELIRSAAGDTERVGAVQSAALLLFTLATALYTIRESYIHTRQVQGGAACVTIGLSLGLLSSFLGIGGGPINLAALSFFFSMDTKKAAQNSLYIILVSQLSNLIYTVAIGKVPDIPAVLLASMVLFGILGASVGRRINRRLDTAAVKKLFLTFLLLVVITCAHNFCRFISV